MINLLCLFKVLDMDGVIQAGASFVLKSLNDSIVERFINPE